MRSPTADAIMPAATSPRFLLAVEGGGSKTTALLTDLEGRGVGRGFGPGSNPHAVGVENARKLVGIIDHGFPPPRGVILACNAPACVT